MGKGCGKFRLLARKRVLAFGSRWILYVGYRVCKSTGCCLGPLGGDLRYWMPQRCRGRDKELGIYLKAWCRLWLRRELRCFDVRFRELVLGY